MTKQDSPWDADGVIERLTYLVQKGEGGTYIANALNREFGTRFSRNAVIGKSHRLTLVRPVPVQVSSETRRQMFKAQQRVKVVPVPVPEFDPSTVFNDTPSSKPANSRKASECAWPLGTDRCCGQEASRGPYCAFHGAIAYVPLKTDQKGLERSLRRALA